MMLPLFFGIPGVRCNMKAVCGLSGKVTIDLNPATIDLCTDSIRGIGLCKRDASNMSYRTSVPANFI